MTSDSIPPAPQPEDPAGPPSARTRVRRGAKRARYDRQTVCDILDAMPMCHVGYVFDGTPYVTPTFQWRDGDHVYWHGSSASRMLRASEGAEVCLTVSILDGFVMARSGFHHSLNTRSVAILGRATKITDPAEKDRQLEVFFETLFPGRWPELRPMTDQERKATTVLSLPIDEASAKVRTGPPVDDEEDYDLPVWSGEVPVRMVMGDPVPDPRNLPGLELPAYLRAPRLG